MNNNNKLQNNLAYLTHPVVLVPLILTGLNDHYLKYEFNNFLTGKISDFCGLFFFPIFLYGLSEFLKSPLGHHRVIKKRKIIVMILVTDFLFIIFKYTYLREIIVKTFSLKIVSDYTDLSALTVNILTYIYSRKYFNQSELKSPRTKE